MENASSSLDDAVKVIIVDLDFEILSDFESNNPDQARHYERFENLKRDLEGKKSSFFH